MWHVYDRDHVYLETKVAVVVVNDMYCFLKLIETVFMFLVKWVAVFCNT
jgi:hypothetical protein